ncbi:MAG: hypothetical protein Q8P32_02570 [Candidatus Komeilibacteria bacterium]|nr:hypothetical protein [Candidatus Komeilibacteria bacterium]
MNIVEKILLAFSKLTTGGLIVLLLLGAITWGYFRFQAIKENRQVAAAAALVKEKINSQPADYFSGCVHPGGITVVSVNHEIFFIVKDQQVFIPRLTEWYNNKAKALAPDLPIQDEDLNVYYLMEYCR